MAPLQLYKHPTCPICNRTEHAILVDDELIDIWGSSMYRALVMAYSHWGIRRFIHSDWSRKLRENRGKMHVDHIYPVRDAFANNVPESVTGSPVNVAVIPARANISKGRKPGHSLEELLAKYEAFILDNAEWNEAISCMHTTGGLPRRESKPHWSRYKSIDERNAHLDELMAPVKKLFAQGMTLDQIAKRLGWYSTTLKSRIQMHRKYFPDSCFKR